MNLIMVGKLMLGAGLGAVAGYLLTYVKTCSSEACKVRPNVMYSVLAGAVFGAAVAYYLAAHLAR